MRWPRSYLFVPGNRGDLVHKAPGTGAEALVFDLEDSVRLGDKARAREVVKAALRLPAVVGCNRPVWVRINAVGSRHWEADVLAVAEEPALTGLRVPKVESLEDLERLDGCLSTIERETGRTSRIPLTCVIETARAVLRLEDIAGHPRVTHVALGAADLWADVGVLSQRAGPFEQWAAVRLIACARAAGIAPPLAPAHTQLSDDAGLRTAASAARDLGFWGQSVIHPEQIAVIHEVFRPARDELSQALALIRRYEECLQQGAPATTREREFIGPPAVRRARQVLELADLQDAEEVLRGQLD